MDLREYNVHKKKFWTHKIAMRKSFGLTKYQQKKLLDQWNILKNKLGTHNIYARKNIGTTKNPQKKNLDSQNTLEQGFQWILCNKSSVQRDFSKKSVSNLLPTLRFLGRLYNFCNFVIIFSLMQVTMICRSSGIFYRFQNYQVLPRKVWLK